MYILITFRFEYLSNEFPKELRIANVTGVIHPNETVYHDWIFAPTQLRNYEFDISCRLNVEIGSRTSVMQIEVSGNSTEGSLIVNKLITFVKLSNYY